MNRYKVVWNNKRHDFVFAPSEVKAYEWALDEAKKMRAEVHSVAPAILNAKTKLETLRLES